MIPWPSASFFMERGYGKNIDFPTHGEPIWPDFCIGELQSAVRLGSHGRGGCWVATAFFSFFRRQANDTSHFHVNMIMCVIAISIQPSGCTGLHNSGAMALQVVLV